MDSLSPNIFVRDMHATIDFYKILGFQLTMTVPDAPDSAAEGQTEKDLIWAMMSNGNVTFMFQSFDSLGTDLPQINRQDGSSLLLYINVKDIRAYFESIKDHVFVLQELHKTFYGATEFAISDVNNYVLCFAEREV